MITNDRQQEKESMAEFIAKKREMFLVQMSLDTKREEIRKLEEKARMKEEALRKSEQASATWFDASILKWCWRAAVTTRYVMVHLTRSLNSFCICFACVFVGKVSRNELLARASPLSPSDYSQHVTFLAGGVDARGRRDSLRHVSQGERQKSARGYQKGRKRDKGEHLLCYCTAAMVVHQSSYDASHALVNITLL